MRDMLEFPEWKNGMWNTKHLSPCIVALIKLALLFWRRYVKSLDTRMLKAYCGFILVDFVDSCPNKEVELWQSTTCTFYTLFFFLHFK